MTIAEFITQHCETREEAQAIADMFVAMRSRQAQNATRWAVESVSAKRKRDNRVARLAGTKLAQSADTGDASC